MRIKILDERYIADVLNIIKNEPFFEYNPKTDSDMTCINFYMVLNELNQFVGFFGLNNREGNLCLCYLYIFKYFRNKKYAEQVLKKVIKTYRNDFRYIYLLCSPKNKIALNLYKKFKFLTIENNFINGYEFENKKDKLFMNEGNYEVCLFSDLT